MASSTKNVKNKSNKKLKKDVNNIYKKHPFLVISLAIIFIVVCIGGYFVYKKYYINNNKIDGELSFHFLMLGNENSGDSIYIKAGENDILIDGGSKYNSSDDIINYVNKYCTDKILEYVIVTHADSDHIACFASNGGIFDEYKCKNIIDFPKTNKDTNVYNKYIEKRDNEVKNDGAILNNALSCYKNDNGANRIISLTDTISMEILYNCYYEKYSSDENNYSVCVMFRHGDRQFLFTGDLEFDGEKELVNYYKNLGTVELYKAGHHGSKTSSNNCLLKEIKPKICVVSCGAGNDEYTNVQSNQFPTQDFIDRISKYTDKVYVTTLSDDDFVGENKFLPMNGNIVVISNDSGVKVECSNNNTLLKDTDWFKAERVMPENWLS